MKSLLGILVLAAAAMSPVVAVATGGSASAAAVDETIALVHQDLALVADNPLVIEFHPSTPIGDRSVQIVTYQAITNRDGLRRAIDGRLGKATDRVQLPADTVKPDPGGNVTITLSTESEQISDAALRFPTEGLYPIAVQILDANGDEASQLVTFVDRLPPEGADPLGSVSVALLASITAPPSLPGANTPLPADALASLAELSKYPPGLALSLSISPEIINRLDGDAFNRLSEVMASGTILSQPLVPLDPSSVTAAKLDDMFTQRLVDGESAIASTGLLPTPIRTVWYAPDGVSNAGAQLLRNLNVRLLVVSSAVYLHATGNNGGLTDYSQLVQAVLASPDDNAAVTVHGNDTGVGIPADDDSGTCSSATATCLPTAVIDPGLSGRLVDGTLSDEQAALYIAADLVAYRDFFAASLSANNRHALVLGLDGSGVANAQRISRTVEMTNATGAARFITIDQLERSSGQAISDGQQLEVHLPQPTPIDLTPRAESLGQLAFVMPAVLSMLVDDTGRTALWSNTIETLYSSSITDAEVGAAEQSIMDATAALKACVVQPSAYTFTLTGRSTNLPLRLTNQCAEPLSVLVRLGAAAGKMDVPAQDTPLTLQANATTTVPVPVTARTNGTFDVTFDVLTPIGQLQITKQVKLRARVNTLTGLPQVITGAGLLILLTWWVRNLRRARRARRSVPTIATHPADGG